MFTKFKRNTVTCFFSIHLEDSTIVCTQEILAYCKPNSNMFKATYSEKLFFNAQKLKEVIDF